MTKLLDALGYVALIVSGIAMLLSVIRLVAKTWWRPNDYNEHYPDLPKSA